MLSNEKSSSKEVTIPFKCGLLRGQHLIGDFQFVTWSYNEQKPYLTYPGLAARLKNAFPSITEPFQIILVDDDNDRIVLPGDDMKETIAALNCFKHRYPAPLRVFLQLPAESLQGKQEKEHVTPALSNDGNPDHSNEVNALLDKVEKIYETLLTFEDRICVFLEQLVNQNKGPRELDMTHQVGIIPSLVSDNSIATASSPSNIQAAVSSGIPRSETSSSSQSHYDDDDWTPVDQNLGASPRRRRRLTTTSSCASQEPLKEDIMQLMADEFDTVMMGFQRNP